MNTTQQRFLASAIKDAWFALYGTPIRITLDSDGGFLYRQPEITHPQRISTDEAFEMLARMTEALAINRENLARVGRMADATINRQEV
jgi:hypothetical protein